MMDHKADIETWTTAGLLSHIKEIEERMPDRAFAFILGSGASFTSGIPTGGKLVEQWLEELQHRLDHSTEKRPLKEWATAEALGIEGFEYERAAEFYPQIFKRRFSHDPEEGYAYLENVMAGKEPSMGYSILAQILADTRHKVVITTNFDNLVADALSTYSNCYPMVCGHESLTHFIRPNLRRPLVAKIHRDLLFAPINDPQGTNQLEDGWPEALSHLFRNYTPIVIGYGGNDGSLMNFLNQLKPTDINGGIWWCYREEDGTPNQEILDTVSKHNGRLIPILGFDEFMLQLGERFDIPLLADKIEQQAKVRAERYREEVKRVQSVLENNGLEESAAKQDARNALHATIEKQDDWWSWELRAQEFKNSDPDKAESIYRQAIKECSQSHELLSNFANFMKDTRKDYDAAELFYLRALKLNSKYAIAIGNYASLVSEVHKDYDKAERLYRKALELDPKRAIATGNFANFMHNIRKKHDEAEQLYRKALELDPESAHTIGNFAVFMETIRKDSDEAELLYRRALELDSEHANNTGNFAVFMETIRMEYDEAEQLYRRTLQLAPEDIDHTGNFANFMETIRKDSDKAEQLYRRGAEFAPENTKIIGQLALFMAESRKNYDEAQRLYRKALDIDPKNVLNTGNYAELLLVKDDLVQAIEFASRLWTLNGAETNQYSAVSLYFLALAQHLKEGFNTDELGRLKSLLQLVELENVTWNFEPLTETLSERLEYEEAAFYKLLSEAIVNREKLPELEQFEVWRELEPVKWDTPMENVSETVPV